jgi:excinuclease UvrABC ATPase subunit
MMCKGLRFKPAVAATLFKGVSYSEILNRPIAESVSILTSLARAKTIVELVSALHLHHLPLGMPIVLLSPSELRRLELIKGLRNSTPTKPGVIILESLHAGFSDVHAQAIETLRDQHPLAKDCTWIEID